MQGRTVYTMLKIGFRIMVMKHDFRLIFDEPNAILPHANAADQASDGATNMARDEAMSLAVGAGGQLPTVRFYGWSPPAISLGQSQRLASVDLARCQADGVDVVRRTTGGLAILHTDELTYSIALPKDHPLAEGDVMTSYRRISQAIIAALRALGVANVDASTVAKEDKAKSPVCFEAPSDYEVMGEVNGVRKKLVGSAQQRRVDAVLQHGSLPLTGDISRICQYLVGAPTPDEVRAHAGTLSEAIGQPMTWRAAAEVWAAAFANTLNLHWVAGEFDPDELAQTQALRQSRYANAEWTRRR